MLDLDKFKIINDTYGHKAGDYVLSHASKVVKNSIRDNDILVRYGGEEFVVLAPSTPPEEIKRLVEKARDGIVQLHIEHVHNGPQSIDWP